MRGSSHREETSTGRTDRIRSVSMSSQSPIPERRTNAWIGKALRLEGKVISKEDLNIDGEVEGSIDVGGHNLTIGPGAAVKADLAAKIITISGAVTGNVQASEKVDLRVTGSVTGDIRAPRFEMAEGATVIGKVETGNRKSG
jgi:cytoskeletal protein CcmA (bactofilin family)